MNFSWLQTLHRPIIVAHRGSSDAAPENTLAAFKQAIEDKADAVEFDIRLTKDHEIVVIHDKNLKRTTNGIGFVYKHSLNELKKLSAGAWFDKKFLSEKIPTLRETLQLLRNRVGINIEIKSDERKNNNLEIAERCMKEINNFSIHESVMISSFNEKILQYIRSLDSKIILGLLYNPIRHLFKPPLSLAKKLGVQYVIMNGTNLRKSMVSHLHDNGFLVGEYTVNTKRRIYRAVRFDIEVIITNRPAFTKKLIG